MTAGDDNNDLGEKLQELEALIETDQDEPAPAKIQVPVLDELVTEADFISHEDEYDMEQVEQQITDLASKLEQKFSTELDQLVSLLKNNLRHSIVEELRHQANMDESGDTDPDTDTGQTRPGD